MVVRVRSWFEFQVEHGNLNKGVLVSLPYANLFGIHKIWFLFT